MKKAKPKEITPYTSTWYAMANEVARDYAPPIRPCKDCGGPVIKGYCCTRCGSVDP
jgi:hypothetical protein